MAASLRDELNFLLTNRVPRRSLTQLAGWYSRIENRALTRLSLAVWACLGGDLRLDEAESSEFRSVHACFTRKLRAGARPIHQDDTVLVSPCDAVVGAFGKIDGDTLVQAKGLSYTLHELLRDHILAEQHHGGMYVTLRLKSTMYHRFHSPMRARLKRIRFISGDTWNVNPISVQRIERLFCRNERVVVEFESPDPTLRITLVPVAAILVASIRVLEIPFPFNQLYNGSAVVECSSELAKGDEIGYFENGSTIIALVSGDVVLSENVHNGETIRMGQPLFRRVAVPHSASRPITNSTEIPATT